MCLSLFSYLDLFLHQYNEVIQGLLVRPKFMFLLGVVFRGGRGDGTESKVISFLKYIANKLTCGNN